MSLPITYPEALQYLRNDSPHRSTWEHWLGVVGDFEELPRGVRQALINRLIEIQKDATSREAEAFKGLREA